MMNRLSLLSETRALILRAHANLRALPQQDSDKADLDEAIRTLNESLTRVDALTMDETEHAEVPQRQQKSDWMNAMTANASLHREQAQQSDSITEYEEAARIYRQLMLMKPDQYRGDLAVTLSKIASLHSKRREYGSAAGAWSEALRLSREDASSHPDDELRRERVARTLRDFANLHSNPEVKQYGQAECEYQEAMRIYKDLDQHDPGRCKSYIADVQNGYAIMLTDLRRFDEAEPLLQSALRTRQEQARRDPTRFTLLEAQAWNNIATLHRNTLTRFEEAIREYDHALRLYRQLDQQNNDDRHLLRLQRTTYNLMRCYELMIDRTPPDRRNDDMLYQAISVMKDLQELYKRSDDNDKARRLQRVNIRVMQDVLDQRNTAPAE